MVSCRISQNVTIKETPVLKQVSVETTSGKGVTSSVAFRIFVSAFGARIYVKVGWRAVIWGKSESKGSQG